MKISPDSIIVSKGKSVKVCGPYSEEAYCFQLCLVIRDVLQGNHVGYLRVVAVTKTLV